MNDLDDGIVYDSLPDDAAIEYRPFSRTVKFSDAAIRDMVTPRPLPPLWKRITHELRWRVPHAWRVLIHGDCDGY